MHVNKVAHVCGWPEPVRGYCRAHAFNNTGHTLPLRSTNTLDNAGGSNKAALSAEVSYAGAIRSATKSPLRSASALTHLRRWPKLIVRIEAHSDLTGGRCDCQDRRGLSGSKCGWVGRGGGGGHALLQPWH